MEGYIGQPSDFLEGVAHRDVPCRLASDIGWLPGSHPIFAFFNTPGCLLRLTLSARWSLLPLLAGMSQISFHNYVEYSRRLLKTLQEEGARSPHNASYVRIFQIPHNIHQRLETAGF